MSWRALLHRVVASLPPGMLRWIGRLQFRSKAFGRLVQAASRALPDEQVRIRHGAAAGMHIHSGRGNPGYALGTSEPQVQAFLQEHLGAGDVFYDVGANVGFLTLVAARLVGPRGHVYAFEPLPANVTALRRNLELNDLSNVDVVVAAVTHSGGRARLALGQSSLDARLTAGAQGDEERTLLVETVSLDEFAHKNGARQPTLVKVDAEGAEFDVLAGMRELVSRCRPTLLCELHQAGDPRSLLRQFEAHASESGVDTSSGYSVGLLDPDDTSPDSWAPHISAVSHEPRC